MERADGTVITKEEARGLILDLLEQEALALGGAVALHDVEDSFVRLLVRDIDELRARTLRRLDAKGVAPGAGAERERPHLAPHPAIEDFLTRLRRARA